MYKKNSLWTLNFVEKQITANKHVLEMDSETHTHSQPDTITARWIMNTAHKHSQKNVPVIKANAM